MLLAEVASFSPAADDGHIEYLIKFAGKQAGRRRFREFLLLGAALQGADLPELPSRFFNTSPSERLPLLDAFLFQACDVFASSPPPALLAFLRLRDKAAFAAAKSTSEEPKVSLDFGSPKCAAQYAARIAETKAKVLSIARDDDQDLLRGDAAWKQVEKGKDGWTAYSRASTSTEPSMRVVCGELARCPPRMAHELVFDPAWVKEMEPNINAVREVERVDEHTSVQHFVMHSIMMQAVRDVIFVRHWCVEPDGTIVHVEFSLDEHALVPPAGSKTVRAVMTCGGTVIRSKGNNSGCKVWRVSNLDPLLGDNIPSFALRKVEAYSAAMLMANMRALERIVQRTRRDLLPRVLAKGPLANWNGKTEGHVVVAAPIADDDQAMDKPQQKGEACWDVLQLALWVALSSALLHVALSK